MTLEHNMVGRAWVKWGGRWNPRSKKTGKTRLGLGRDWQVISREIEEMALLVRYIETNYLNALIMITL